VLGKTHGTSTFFCLSYCCLEVGIYPEIPATGHLDKSFLGFPLPPSNSDMIPKFQLATSGILWNNTDLSSTNKNLSLWRPPNYLSKLCSTPLIRNKNYAPLSQATTSYYSRKWCSLSFPMIFPFHPLLYYFPLPLYPAHLLKTTWRELKSMYFTNQIKPSVGNLTEQKPCIRLREFPTSTRIQKYSMFQLEFSNFLRMTKPSTSLTDNDAPSLP
jgi:hypothetical protein